MADGHNIVEVISLYLTSKKPPEGGVPTVIVWLASPVVPEASKITVHLNVYSEPAKRVFGARVNELCLTASDGSTP